MISRLMFKPHITCLSTDILIQNGKTLTTDTLVNKSLTNGSEVYCIDTSECYLYDEENKTLIKTKVNSDIFIDGEITPESINIINNKVDNFIDDVNERIEQSDLDKVVGLGESIDDVKDAIGSEEMGTDADTVKGAIAEHTTRLNNFTEYSRKFKPKFGKALYWGWVGSDGTYGTTRWASITKEIDDIVNYGVEEICVVLQTIYRENNIIIVDNLDTVSQAIEYAKNKKINISCIKVHQKEMRIEMLNNIENSAYIEEIGNKYYTTLNTITSKFTGVCDKFVVLNECDDMYKNDVFQQFILDCISKVKEKGFKGGIVTSGLPEFYAINDTIISSLDFLSVNQYPMISTKGLKTPITDVCGAFINSGIFEWDKYCAYKYPNKERIITETGVQDCQGALIQPVNWRWEEIEPTNEGKVQALYLEGLFNAFDKSDISSISYWYPFEYNSQIINNIIKKYLNGGN